jgi:hypothetical protein
MVHDYLGMVIDYLEEGKVKFSMHDYVDGLLDEAPDDMDELAVTLAEMICSPCEATRNYLMTNVPKHFII